MEGERDLVPRKYGDEPDRNYRLYFLIDTSESMGDEEFFKRTNQDPSFKPIDQIRETLPVLLDELGNRRKLQRRTFVSVISFNSTSKVLLPSVAVEKWEVMGEYQAEGSTSYLAALRKARECIEKDERTLFLSDGRHWWKPILFVITDGQPDDEPWIIERNKLVEQFDAIIVALGFGRARESTLNQLATETNGIKLAFINARDVSQAGLVDSISNAILRSVVDLEERNTFDMRLPVGMRHARTLV